MPSCSWWVSEMISAIASSTTLRVLENGALKAAIPWRAVAARSIWFVSMQNAPIASRSGAASSTASVTWVVERIPSTWTPTMASVSCCSVNAPARVSTCHPTVLRQTKPVRMDVFHEQSTGGPPSWNRACSCVTVTPTAPPSTCGC